MQMERNLVLVSGYYGFGNLGDEAILEEICNELKQLVKPEDIIVLSANPEETAATFGVRSMQRKNFGEFWTMLSQCRLFISGGGGLFQNTRTLGSIIFYGLQILMAKAHQTHVLIYAQGIGPLRGKLAENLCRQFFAQADTVLVRDDASRQYLDSWGLKGQRTADPVWSLEPSELPASVQDQLNAAGAARTKSKCVGLSLRPSGNLTDAHLRQLADGLESILAPDDVLLLMPMQPEQDLEVLQSFDRIWLDKGKKSVMFDARSLTRPSQWVDAFAQLKWLVGMRLHAIIMALKAGKAVAGIGYDPKVTQLLSEFEQRCLILTKEEPAKDWVEGLKDVANGLASYSSRAESKSKAAKNLSCQNFEVLARILNMPREPEG